MARFDRRVVPEAAIAFARSYRPRAYCSAATIPSQHRHRGCLAAPGLPRRRACRRRLPPCAKRTSRSSPLRPRV